MRGGGWDNVMHHYEDGGPDDDAFKPAFERSSEHTARKTHNCDNCEGSIYAGERYSSFIWLDEDGQLQVMKAHMDGDACQAMREKVEAWRAGWSD